MYFGKKKMNHINLNENLLLRCCFIFILIVTFEIDNYMSVSQFFF